MNAVGKTFSCMLLERIYDDGLAQASYLVACQQTGSAVIVDPNRDIAQYIDAVERRSLMLECVTETHIHADFVSGARDLARETGATLLLLWRRWSGLVVRLRGKRRSAHSPAW